MKEYTLPTGQAAKLLGVTPQTVRDLVARGELTADERRHGTRPRLFLNRAEVEALAAQRSGTT